METNDKTQIPNPKSQGEAEGFAPSLQAAKTEVQLMTHGEVEFLDRHRNWAEVERLFPALIEAARMVAWWRESFDVFSREVPRPEAVRAARLIAVQADAASQAAGGPRFLFDEWVAEVAKLVHEACARSNVALIMRLEEPAFVHANMLRGRIMMTRAQMLHVLGELPPVGGKGEGEKGRKGVTTHIVACPHCSHRFEQICNVGVAENVK